MSGKLDITRRDFLNGAALCLAAGTTLSPLEILAREPARYPPALTGLRGSQPGSFEIAHAVALAGKRYPRPTAQTDADYDLVVVGGGISGLAAAHLYRQRAGADRRVLVLDNHDDFGGHARRNEFEVDGETLIGYGGSQSIDTPSAYSAVARGLLEDLGIRVERFYDYFDQDYFRARGMRPSIYFDAAVYGEHRTLPNVFGDYRGAANPDTVSATIDAYPLSESSKRSLERLLAFDADPFAGLDNAEKLRVLRALPYTGFLRKHAGATDEVVALIRDDIKGLWGVGWDALPTIEAWKLGHPGTRGIELEPDAFIGRSFGEEPYIFHFPDGNATIARALVRDLVPGTVDAATVEALVSARVDYAALDTAASSCRVRLNSTAVNVRHTPDDRHVDVTYIRDGRAERVRGRHVILACYNAMIPHICPEVPAAQAEAIGYAEKIPLVYTSIAVRNWLAWAELGTHSVYAPQSRYMHSFGLDFPVSIGDYRYTKDPSTPTVLHGSFVPTEPGRGLTDRQQSVAGRARLYEMSFDDHEQAILAQLDGALSAGGFDAGRDIAAITVNRWPHGYTYEYNPLFEPAEYGRWNGPHITARVPIGRISIANSDASAYAYVDGAIDAAHRAVGEQIWTA